MEKHIFLAFDLGATSGRSILGILENGKVEIKIQGTNKFTRLYVNGRLHQELGPITLYAVSEKDAFDSTYDPNQNAFAPVVYNPNTKMYYQRTLVFPLKRAGQFKSRITDLKVYNYLK